MFQVAGDELIARSRRLRSKIQMADRPVAGTRPNQLLTWSRKNASSKLDQISQC